MEKTSDLFGINRGTIAEWIRLRNETGALKTRPLDRPHKKADPNDVREYFDNNPDSSQKDAAEKFGIASSSIQHILKKIKYTRKKKLYCTKKEAKLNVKSI
jgi:transposase